MANEQILMGNEAIGRGVIEAGCTLFSSYPGTPASEILKSVVKFSKQSKTSIHTEWSVNEKIAYETALAHSYTGKRAAVAMKQVGLNVASDPFMRSAYLGVKGGFLIIVADDPGPHSSQTEQDTRFFAQFAKIPVFDPSSPAEAKEMVKEAFLLSEKLEIPVVLRPTTRVCHARQNVKLNSIKVLKRKTLFKKEPARWVATPGALTSLHKGLNDKIEEIKKDFYPICNNDKKPKSKLSEYCIVSSGVVYMYVYEMLESMGVLQKVDLYKVNVPYPLNSKFINDISKKYKKILVVEETYPVIEMQLLNSEIKGKVSKDVSDCGELTPEKIEKILVKFLSLNKKLKKYEDIKGVRPTLCAGCPHRASFYAIKKTFPKGIFPSDIGCYTLGVNFGAVDTCHCMGACISFGAGFYHSFAENKDSDFPTIVVTIGDSTFFHSGVPALVNAVFTGARIIVVILDNSTTAMTGGQPTPQVGYQADGNKGKQVFIEDLVKASGVKFLKKCDPYKIKEFKTILKEADKFCRSAKGGVAVIISKHPCMMYKDERAKQEKLNVFVSEECIGCKICIKGFECPALVFDETDNKVFIDNTLCIGCGVCLDVCPTGAILTK